MKIGIIACDIMKRELDSVLKEFKYISELIYLDAALHCKPKAMRETIIEQINSIKGEVDAIFLGYGYCQSLRNIEDEFDIPIILPQMDDCISILFTPEKYAEEVRREVGTWFMTPGWAEVGVEMVIKENHLDRVTRYGKDPVEMAKRLFTHYKRGLYIDTGTGNDDYFVEKSKEFCKTFDLRLERTKASSAILEKHLEKTKLIAEQKKVLL